MKGILAYVFRSPDIGDCTNGGWSSTNDRALILGVMEDGVTSSSGKARYTPVRGSFEPQEGGWPPVWIKVRRLGTPVLSIVPAVEQQPGGVYVEAPGWFMFGGNFLHAHDSRVWDAVEDVTGQRFYGAVAIHDRQES